MELRAPNAFQTVQPEGNTLENHEVTSSGRSESKGSLRALLHAGVKAWGPILLKTAARWGARALWCYLTGEWPGDNWPLG
jgi:hypothetical protein